MNIEDYLNDIFQIALKHNIEPYTIYETASIEVYKSVERNKPITFDYALNIVDRYYQIKGLKR